MSGGNLISGAFYDTLTGDSYLATVWGSYGGLPCVWTTKKVPAKAPRPYAWSYGHPVDEAFDTKDLRGREIMRDIWIVYDDTGSEVNIEATAEYVRDLFHRLVLNIGSGYENFITRASGPRVGPVAPGSTVTARIVTVRLIYQGT